MPGSGGSSASSSSSSEALKKPLLSSTEDTPLIPKKAGVPELLYDRDAIFALQPHVIDGYLILLGKPEVAKGETCKPGGADLGDLDLQFQALQSGNVLDACFGASSAPSTLPSASAAAAAAAAASAGGKERAVKEAKEFLGRLGGAADPKGRQAKQQAVAAYAEIFVRLKEHGRVVEEQTGPGVGFAQFICCCMPSPVASSGVVVASKQRCLAEINAAFSVLVNAA